MKPVTGGTGFTGRDFVPASAGEVRGYLVQITAAIAFLACIVACSTGGPPSPGSIQNIEVQSASIGPVAIGMNEAEIQALGLDVRRESSQMEGEEEPFLTVRTSPSIILLCPIDEDGKVIEINTTAGSVRDGFGLGVGSTLKQLRQSYRNGKLLIGDEEGRFAVFDAGDGLLFRLDKAQIAPGCFDTPQSNCAVGGDTRVESISLE